MMRAHLSRATLASEELCARVRESFERAVGIDTARNEFVVRPSIHRLMIANGPGPELEALNHRLRRAMMETPHRVKNSLQVISAMVDIRLQHAQDHVPVEDVRSINSCVATLTQVHALLTDEAKKDGDAATISVSQMLDRLLPLMQSTAERYKIEYHLQDVRLPGRIATSLALITNELVSNALKNCRAHVDVTLHALGDRAELIVSDDGPGGSPLVLSFRRRLPVYLDRRGGQAIDRCSPGRPGIPSERSG